MLLTLVSLTATATALTAAALKQPTPSLRMPPCPCLRQDLGSSRSGLLVAVAGWATQFDEVSGHPYYCDEQGHCQWEPPEGLGGAQVAWHVLPAVGTLNEYTARNGEEHVLGRWDMAEQSLYVSRAQCLVRVAADGSATLQSIGKPSTLCRARDDARWCHLLKYESRALADGDQISLEFLHPERAIFTVTRQEESADAGNFDDVRQYSDDGQWMWNGMEWRPVS